MPAPPQSLNKIAIFGGLMTSDRPVDLVVEKTKNNGQKPK
jgi:hypothetical protein